MSKKIKIISLIVIILVVLIIGAGAFLWTMMSQPLYKPGMVRAGQNLRAPLTPPQQPNNENFWQVEPDIQLYHFAQGKGRNVLIVHGGPGFPYRQPWPGLDPLTDQYRFHYYDQRGCGKSTRPFDRFTSTNYYENMTTLDRTLGLGAQVADMERIRHLLGEDKLILIGHSFGGFLASLYAAEFPEHVEALILLSPADVLVMPQAEEGLFEEVRTRLPKEKQTEYTAYLERYLDFGNIFSRSEADMVALNQEFGQYYQAVMDIPLSEEGEAGGWMTHAMYFSMGQQHDYRASLRAVEAPVLVIHGANDLQSEAASRTYAEAFPQASFRVIADASHFAFLEKPETFAAVVEEFLNSLQKIEMSSIFNDEDGLMTH